ncbi:MAG: hypothetical protein ABI674_00565 [Spartobacteria bacterium]
MASLRFFLCLFFVVGTELRAAAEKSVEFQGTVSAVNLEARTITVRVRDKDFVFQINPERCKIVKDGRNLAAPGAQAAGLAAAQIADSVVGHFEVEGEKAIVTDLHLTTKPETGVRVKDKPGFIASPYDKASAGSDAIDVRGYRRGTMLVDQASGKIFLVP